MDAKNVCEIMDSYALPFETSLSTRPVQESLDPLWKYVVLNGRSLQWLYSQSSGDCTLMQLIDRAEGHNLIEFFNRFKKHDYLNDDHKVAQMFKKLIEKEVRPATKRLLFGLRRQTFIARLWFDIKKSLEKRLSLLCCFVRMSNPWVDHLFEITERHEAFRFHTPSSLMVVGPSGFGKTAFSTKLLWKI